MIPLVPGISYALTCISAFLALFCSTAAHGAAPARDSRNFSNGNLIPVENYCDQPRIVVTRDGTWICILTTGKAHEGAEGQHVVSTTSKDKGRTWSPLVDVEPPEKPISAYALSLLTPADRIYAFYCFNGDSITTLPDGTPIRADMQGWLCFRYSDDKGQTWSERHRIPMRQTAADRNNQWGGKLQMWWAIGTPAVYDGKMIFGFTKLGRYILHEGEGWFCRSDNVLTEKDPAKLDWQILPDGDHGLRNPEFGSVQEEFDVVHLEGDDLFCVNRTAKGHAASAYSRDGGHTWTQPDMLRYSPGGRPVKQPRACAKIWKTRNGRYLLWYHNNGTTTYNNGPNAGSRNIAWLSAGSLKDGLIHWSQPEIVAYVEGGLEGCSYPDLIEDDGSTYICATQKTEARVMKVEPDLLDGLWQQETCRSAATNGLVLSLGKDQLTSRAPVRPPRLAALGGEIERRKSGDDAAGGLTLDLAMRLSNLAPGQIIVDSRDAAGRGYVLHTTERQTVRFEMCDGWQAAFWDCDDGVLKTNALQRIAVIVDGRARAISFVVDGQLCDGGTQRLFGFGRFNANMKDISGGSTLQLAPRGQLTDLRIYGRALRTSEAVGNFQAFAAQERL